MGVGNPSGDNSLRVLVVDDEEHILFGMEAVLGDQFKVTTCSDPYVALHIASSQPIDVLCADYSMPRMNGLELVERLAQQNSIVAAVLVTGKVEAYLEEASRRMARDGRPLAVLTKPCDPVNLIRAVERVGQFSRMRHAVEAMRRDVQRAR